MTSISWSARSARSPTGGSMIDPKVVDGAGGRAGASGDVAAWRADRRGNATCCGDGRGQEQRVDRRVDLVLTERSVEKVINSMFMKLGLTWEPAVHKRVKAVILYLAESDVGQRDNGSQP